MISANFACCNYPIIRFLKNQAGVSLILELDLRLDMIG